jgi:type II secretory pathway component PulC
MLFPCEAWGKHMSDLRWASALALTNLFLLSSFSELISLMYVLLYIGALQKHQNRFTRNRAEPGATVFLRIVSYTIQRKTNRNFDSCCQKEQKK